MSITGYRAIALAATIVIASAAFAQGGGGRGGQQRGGMQFGNMANSESALLQRADVQKDIKLTDDQKAKLTVVRQEMSEKIQAQFQGMRGGRGGGAAGGGTTGGGAGGNTGGQAGTRGGVDMAEVQKQMEALQKEANDKSKAILTEEQWKRLGQIKVQLAGANIFLETEFGKKLGLKAQQKIEINRLIEDQAAANREIMGKMRDQNADRTALMGEIRKNDVILRDAVEKILTDEQKATLADLEGPKFVADPNQQNNLGGFGGRGGGGGGTGGGGGRGGSTGGGL
ncbi:MAG: Spy/CpxP family protein refolding chaperone [Fimbriimonadaceae bacterium]